MRPPGEYKQSLGGWKTFLPARLPPAFELSKQNMALAEQATHRLGQVDMCQTLLPNAELLVYSSLQREALASSTIEGTIATPDELVRFQASQRTDREPVREVANYRDALAEGREALRTMPISINLILRIHEVLMFGVRGDNLAGEFKRQQNFIGGFGSDAAFTPAAPEDVPALIDNLERYLNDPQDVPRVIQVAISHYQFETIHPFGDGNGRVGRLLVMLQLIHLGLLQDPLIHPSVYFERTRSQYYDALQVVREKGAWNSYLSYFQQGIIQQCEATITFTKTFIAIQEQIRERVHGVQRHASVERTLGEFFKMPVQDIASVTRNTGMSHNTVQSALNVLRQMNIVTETTGQKTRRIFLCKPVYDLVFGDVLGSKEPIIS